MYSPWVLYANKVKSLFEQDKDVKVVLDNDAVKLTIMVNGDSKADAIGKLLPDTVNFGNVDLHITVVPSNHDDSPLDLIQRAFEGNPVIKDIISREVLGIDMNYVVFKKEVVQYKSDDIGDVNGITSTLYENLADELIKTRDGVYFCTATSNY